MANEKFWLVFSEEPNKKYFIDEVINFDKVDFSLDQKEEGMGRDVSLSGGKINFRFTINRLHYLEKLLYYLHIYGFEAGVKIFIELEDGSISTGELDFYTAETNDFDYLECSAILESELQVFKRRSSTKVDLFSDKDINGEAITPLQPINMLLQAKPSFSISEWEQTKNLNATLTAQFPSKSYYAQINPAQNLISYGIADSYTFFEPIKANPGAFSDSSFKVFLADSNYKNVIINIPTVEISFTTDVDNGGDGYVEFSLNIYKGVDFATATKTQLLTVTKSENQSYSFNGSLGNTNIGDVLRGESVWVQFDAKVILSTDIGTLDPKFEFFLDINNMSMKISANSIAYNSITPTFRLIDVMKQVCKSISGLAINAPRYDLNGQFYDTVLTNGKLLGGNINDPFYISWEDIEKSINSEHKADNEIQLDGRVFVGIEEDFYKPIECGFFDNTQFSGMTKKTNPIYAINKFGFKYAKYQSLKETTEPNSESTIHGESQLTPYNQKVENSKECSVDWTRDAILLDVQQRLSTKVSEDTATQDDDTIFAIDTVKTLEDQKFTESTPLQHTYSSTSLSLRNNGEVNFLVLGITVGSEFRIMPYDSNAGTYSVFAITNTELQLTKINPGAISSANDGLRLTKYEYTIEKETIPLTNRTNEGFTTINNLLSPDRYSNLRYSVQRNIRNYWDSFLATVNLYHKEREIKNTYYKNNGKCETEYNGLRVVEKEAFIPEKEPLVTPFMYDKVVFANVDFSDFITLQTNIRSLRGFIRTIDNKRRVLKLFPIKMSYENKSRQLTILGQEKFEKAYLTITNANGIITINDETRVRKVIYDPIALDRDKEVVLYDMEKQRLYNGIYWDKVSINGATAETIEILKNWLDLL